MTGHALELLVHELAHLSAVVAPDLSVPLAAVTGGSHLVAAPALDSLASCAEAGPDRRALALGWARLATHLGVLALADGGGRQMIQLGEGTAQLVAGDAALFAAVAAASPDVRPIVELSAVVVPGLLQWQAMLPPNATFHPTLTAEVLGHASAALDEARSTAEMVGHRAALLTELVAADLSRRAGDRASAERVWEAARAEVQPREPVVAGLFDLVRGDWSAAPLSSPAVWNTALQDVAGPSSDLGGIEALEGRTGVDPVEAERRYALAEPAFAGHSRLLGHLSLRRGWLAQLAGDAARAADLAGQAGRHYVAGGAHAGSAVARIHVALCALGAGALPADVESASAVGEWARDRGGPSWAIGLGQLCSRVSRHWSVSGVALEPALAALDIAAAVMRPVDARDPLLRCDIDRAQVRSEAGDTRGARLLVEEALRAMPSAAQSEGAQTARSTREALLLLELYRLSTVERDGAAMRSAAGRFWGSEAAPGPGRVIGPVLPPPDADALGSLYDAQRAEDAGDGRAAARLMDEAEHLARANGQTPTLVAVLAARHDYPAAAALTRQMQDAAAAALARGDLGVPIGGVGAPTGGLPPQIVRPMIELEARRLRFRGLAALVRLRDPAGAATELDTLAATHDPWWQGLASEREAMLCLGRLREQQGDLEGARTAYLQGVADVEARRAALSSDLLKTAMGGDVVTGDLYRGACRVALKARDVEAAFLLAERGQSRALLDLLAANAANAANTASSASAGGSTRLPLDLVAAWRGTNAEVERLGRQLLHALAAPGTDPATVSRLRDGLEHARGEADGLASRLADADPGYWKTVNPSAGAATLAQICAALPPGTLLLRFTVSAPDALAWAVTADGVVASHADEDQWELAGLASRLQVACATGREDLAAAQHLSDRLLGPMAAAIRGAERVVVVSSGDTVGLAFHVLPFDGQPLGVGRIVSYLPSAGVLPLLGPPRSAGPDGPPPSGRAAGPALVVGDPAAMSFEDPYTAVVTPAPPLAGARVEAAYVASLLPGSICLIGARATETAVRAAIGRAPVVHLATHGYLDATSVQSSAVLLANGDNLNVAEIAGMRLGADLVVLSACHTGGGEPAGGAELMGLSRAVLAAGARAVMVTLWEVDDVSSALLMGHVYEQLRAGADPATALHRAQVWLIGLDRDTARSAYETLRSHLPADADAGPQPPTDRRVRPARVTPTGYAHPRHWAPFILVGA